jgi:MFS family permease
MGAKVAENGVFYLYTAFILIFARQEFYLYPLTSILFAIGLAALVMIATVPLYGALSDRLGRRPVYLFGSIFSGLFAFPFFWLVQSGQVYLMTLAVVGGLGVGWTAMYAPQASFFSELFNTRVRYTGASFGGQVTTIFVGGLAPFIAASLLNLAGKTWPIALYLIGLSAVTTLAVFLAPETVHRDISAEIEVHPDEEEVTPKIAA